MVKTPLLTVDAVIKVQNGGIVLIKRKNPPYGWALPGGFVDCGETVEHAVIREVGEETSLDFTITGLLGVYSDPARDARGHVVTVVFCGIAVGLLNAADDASEAKIFPLNELPDQIAFDHAIIIKDFHNKRELC